MKQLRKSYLLERLVYIFIWLIVFLVPVVVIYLPIGNSTLISFSWKSIMFIWGYTILPFFLLFCLNNFWLVPCFFLKKKYVHYTLLVFLFVGLFIWSDAAYIRQRIVNNFPPVYERSFEHLPEEAQSRNAAKSFRPLPPGGFRGHRHPPGAMAIPLISRFLVAFLMIGFNIAVKLIFKSLRDEEVMKELERCKLQSELEYLKYQINPHFFMNTLNNIHVLVELNVEQAQKAIVELSKMMRYVLYEANNKTILLEREILFLRNYIELMKLRYTESVNITVSLPDEVPPVEIPPLLYISFIENAFKHGVNCQADSQICVSMQVEDGNLVFNCSNTNSGQSEEQHRGIGLDNIRKRLRLLYHDNYRLSINQSPDRFNVLLITPFL